MTRTTSGAASDSSCNRILYLDRPFVSAERRFRRSTILRRYFAPHFGIDEDPVTGSAHRALGP
ncbi:MAG TPA: PhzF family phenazine biosynthesis protein [Rhodothermales bacterium]